MPQSFIFKTASFFPKVVSFEERPGGWAAGEGMSFILKRVLGSGFSVLE